MDWFKSSIALAQKQAQETVEKAKIIATQATEKAKDLAAIAAEEAQSRLAHFTAVKPVNENSPDLQDAVTYRVTAELVEYVKGLTYSAFSDFPLALLPNVEDRLSDWQEKHALLILQAVPQLQDLRFVLCPRRLTDRQFWSVYFELCKQYLSSPQAVPHLSSTTSSAYVVGYSQVEGAGPLITASTTLASIPQSSGMTTHASSTGQTQRGSEPPAQTTEAAAREVIELSIDGEDDDLECDDDPELEAYLQEALKVADGDADLSSGECSAEDLDEYISQLNKELHEDAE